MDININNNNRIPDEWHKEYAYNCLTEEQFKLLQDTVSIDVEFACECSECRAYTVHRGHRCDCGNRRCYFQYDSYYKYFHIDVD